ncbi:lipoprotein lipase-like [Harmonia axyridis]|uniref:lipoprotein lipase-like n=1 Tax=Harmonia axyridis TaxID=115357 RepID=UPI001E279C5E|nr:lipoprotein lipase-like [Harmonia axyridis]
MSLLPSKLIVFFLTYFVYSSASVSQFIRFSLYTAEHADIALTLRLGAYTHELYRLDRSTQLFVIVHGWLQSSNDLYVSYIRYLTFRSVKKNAIILTVDWTKLARNEYEVAKKYNSAVANITTEVLTSFLGPRKIKFQNAHIICHCMGCHIAAMACKNIWRFSKKKIDRITALDPAGPGYYSKMSERLGPNDADVVFVVHTDAFRFGYGSKCGNIDFYPNGGKHPQPGCLNFSGIVDYNLCSHQRSIELYIESLDDPVFYGIKCPRYRDYRKGLCSSNAKLNFAKKLRKEYQGTYFYMTNPYRPFLRKK